MLEYDRSKRKWILYTRDGSRILGTHKTKKDALRQERAILWSQSKRKRKNPLVEREGGLIVNPGSAEGLWYHGSRSSEPLTKFAKPPAPFSSYYATFFSTSKEFGENFATDNVRGGRGDRRGWVHVVAVKDVPIFDVEEIYTDRLTEDWSLTAKGEEFAELFAEVINQWGAMSDDEVEAAVQRTLSFLRAGDWEAFDETGEFFTDLVETFKELLSSSPTSIMAP